MMRGIHTVLHSRGEQLKNRWKIFALIAGFVLMQCAQSPAYARSTDPTAAVQASVAAEAGPSTNTAFSFELVPPALSGASKLLVQLIGEESGAPETGSAAEASLSDLQDGQHTARVVFLDDKNQPLQGGVALVHFRLHSTNVTAGSPQAAPLPGEIRGAAPAPPPIPPELRKDGDPAPPIWSSPLPLVSLIGFALLVGGIIPGMRLRRVHTRTAHGAHL
jgi:hypothetical protein